MIQRAHLPEDFLEDCDLLLAHANGTGNAAKGATVPAATTMPGSPPVARSPVAVPRLGDTTAAALAQALAAHGGNVSASARALGVSRNTVYRHLKAAQAAVRPEALRRRPERADSLPFRVAVQPRPCEKAQARGPFQREHAVVAGHRIDDEVRVLPVGELRAAHVEGRPRDLAQQHVRIAQQKLPSAKHIGALPSQHPRLVEHERAVLRD